LPPLVINQLKVVQNMRASALWTTNILTTNIYRGGAY
jgi:hypothetical protein